MFGLIFAIVALTAFTTASLNAAARYLLGREAIRKATRKDLPVIVRALMGHGDDDDLRTPRLSRP